MEDELQVKRSSSDRRYSYVVCLPRLLTDQLGVDHRVYTVERPTNQRH